MRTAISQLGHDWRKPDGKPFVRPLAVAGRSAGGAAKVFGADTGEILATAETKDGRCAASRCRILKAVLHSEIKTAESDNSRAFARRDPKLKNEFAYSRASRPYRHHPPVKATAQHGALDNASGVAPPEVARLFQGKRPSFRLFLIDTAEEKGLIGAEYSPATRPCAAVHRRGRGPGRADLAMLNRSDGVVTIGSIIGQFGASGHVRDDGRQRHGRVAGEISAPIRPFSSAVSIRQHGTLGRLARNRRHFRWWPRRSIVHAPLLMLSPFTGG